MRTRLNRTHLILAPFWERKWVTYLAKRLRQNSTTRASPFSNTQCLLSLSLDPSLKLESSGRTCQVSYDQRLGFKWHLPRWTRPSFLIKSYTTLGIQVMEGGILPSISRPKLKFASASAESQVSPCQPAAVKSWLRDSDRSTVGRSSYRLSWEGGEYFNSLIR